MIFNIYIEKDKKIQMYSLVTMGACASVWVLLLVAASSIYSQLGKVLKIGKYLNEEWKINENKNK